MEEFFKPSASSIIKMIEDQWKTSKTEISSIFLVGGFAANDWLFNTLKEKFDSFDVCRPGRDTNKAVAEGAISYHIDHFVQARVAKYSYGTDAFRVFNPLNREHVSRIDSVCMNIRGHPVLECFSTILAKHSRVSEAQEFRESYSVTRRFSSSLSKLKEPIICFRGSRSDPRWLDEEKKLYSTLCYVEADLSNVQKTEKYSSATGAFYEVTIDIILSLGLVEFKACIAWQEDGVEKRGPAQLVYDPDIVIEDGYSPII